MRKPKTRVGYVIMNPHGDVEYDGYASERKAVKTLERFRSEGTWGEDYDGWYVAKQTLVPVRSSTTQQKRNKA